MGTGYKELSYAAAAAVVVVVAATVPASQNI